MNRRDLLKAVVAAPVAGFAWPPRAEMLNPDAVEREYALHSGYLSGVSSRLMAATNYDYYSPKVHTY